MTETVVTRTPSGVLTATVKSAERSEVTELADTDPADWNLQQAGAGLALDAPGKEAALLAEEPAKPKVTKETLYSTAKVHSIFNGNGHLGKHYYRFQNVRLTKKSLTFYMKPGERRWSGLCGSSSNFWDTTYHTGRGLLATLHLGVSGYAQLFPPA